MTGFSKAVLVPGSTETNMSKLGGSNVKRKLMHVYIYVVVYICEIYNTNIIHIQIYTNTNIYKYI